MCLGGDAEWIRRLFDDIWFPDARKVVDCYHAAECLWSAALARHGDGDLAAAWAKKPCGMLGVGRLDDALAELRRRGGDVEECRRAARYLAERRDRTRYDELRAAGLPIGSGRVEAGCKNIIDQRMIRCGHALERRRHQSGVPAPLRPPERVVRRLLESAPRPPRRVTKPRTTRE